MSRKYRIHLRDVHNLMVKYGFGSLDAVHYTYLTNPYLTIRRIDCAICHDGFFEATYRFLYKNNVYMDVVVNSYQGDLGNLKKVLKTVEPFNYDMQFAEGCLEGDNNELD